jgi:hypothetical protein
MGETDPKAFLDRICESITGVRKVYISDLQGAILAESSLPGEDFSVILVRSFPKYIERLGKLSFGEAQSMVIESDECCAVLVVSSPLLITFLCEKHTNFSLLTQIPSEMKEFIEHLKSFIDA